MSERFDVAIIGAGPAGLAAAGVLGQAGCSVTLLDEQAEPGGQIYRGIGSASGPRKSVLGADYAAGASLLPSLAHDSVTHIAGATVWEVTPERDIYYSQAGKASGLKAEHVLVATGATERPMPFPGWTLPGVMTAGAGQILLKTAGMLPPSPCVLAGSGPLLFLIAAQYLAAGFKIDAIVETTPRGNLAKALPHLPGALLNNKYLRKGLAMLASLRKAGIPHYKASTSLVAEGDGQVEALKFTSGGKPHRLACASLLIHNGVVPNVQISRSLNLDHAWDSLQHCWHPVTDASGATSLAGFRVAGDGGGIAGAEAAAHGGRLAALAILEDLGKITGGERQARSSDDSAALKWHGRARPFLDALYAPAREFLEPADSTIVCRCEEVTAGKIREFVDLGCLGPNQAKSFGRAGMGPCQGRYCGLTVSSVIAAKLGKEMDEVGYYRIRPPLKPITLRELASMDLDDDADERPAA
ncbi:MAG: FAD-dependent oxidoreductase [Rhodobiaceae bacterium]|nr:FAD-dependent oxidoreductase [Rhodobiaceae bacterium]MCC0049727.1 FAD-dependent oxidoreductase [Rhodobiaceae bacterium]